ncbi:MAG: tetratricopeptide repeat protein [Rhodospirillales bacterium]|nr:tetratricopeptide repeat protein [Rhodospirillales bacterium]
MNPRVLRRFIIIAGISTFVMFSFWAVFKSVWESPPGDYEVRQGDILLTDRKFDEAMDRFDGALKISPNHRGALMGRALVYLQSERYPEAEAELTFLIDYLKKSLESDDRTGIGTLAAAYSNRGILYDRTGRYEKALADYIDALKTDAEAVDGPGIVDKVIYGTPDAATVKNRAIYLKQQLDLPKEKRLLRIPEIDKKQRTYKP